MEIEDARKALRTCAMCGEGAVDLVTANGAYEVLHWCEPRGETVRVGPGKDLQELVSRWNHEHGVPDLGPKED